MLTDEERTFLHAQRVAHLATADKGARPHLAPVCYALLGQTVYVAIDEKPKRSRGTPLKRVRNIMENPEVAFVVDHYEEDWTRLGWVLLRGRAEILRVGSEYDRAHGLLRERYQQLTSMNLTGLPVIAVRIAMVTSWGDLRVANPIATRD